MKITLTHAEMQDLVAKSLGVASGTVQVEIFFAGDSPTARMLIDLLTKIPTVFPNFRTSEKIAAIKFLRVNGPQEWSPSWGREVSTLGLADAKWAVENLDSALDNLRKCGKIQP